MKGAENGDSERNPSCIINLHDAKPAGKQLNAPWIVWGCFRGLHEGLVNPQIIRGKQLFFQEYQRPKHAHSQRIGVRSDRFSKRQLRKTCSRKLTSWFKSACVSRSFAI